MRHSPRTIPRTQAHDMRRPVTGYIEDPRLVPDSGPGPLEKWRSIGDLYLDSGSLDDALGGFSISGLEMMRRPENATVLLYLPCPHYNDEGLLAHVCATRTLASVDGSRRAPNPYGRSEQDRIARMPAVSRSLS